MLDTFVDSAYCFTAFRINDKTEWRCHYCHLMCVLSSVWVKRWGQDCVWSVGLDNSLLARSFNFLLSKSKTHTFINFCFPFFSLNSCSKEMQKNLMSTRTRRFLILLLLQQKHSKVEFRDKHIFLFIVVYQKIKNLAFPLFTHIMTQCGSGA